MKYRVSVIIPVYNCEKYLKRAIKSVINQDNFDSDELILVDDGSTDASGSICDSYSSVYSNIKTIHQPNAGVSAARNAGIQVAEGEWISFLDSDDYLLDGAFDKMLRFSEADLISAKYKSNKLIESASDNTFNEGSYDITSCIELLNNALVNTKLFYNCWSRLYKREMIVSNSITFPVNVKVAEDMVFVYSYLKWCNKIAFVDNPVYFYNVNTDNTTSVISKSFDVDHYIYQFYKNYFSENTEVFKQIDSIFTKRAFNSIKIAAYYMPLHESVSYIKTILYNDDFQKCYSESNLGYSNFNDKMIDKFIKKYCPLLIYFIVQYTKLKSTIYKLISGDKND